MTTTNYPLPDDPEDPRFDLGLALDVRDVLLAHGYPELTGMDVADLQVALLRFLHRERGPVGYRDRT